MQLTFFILTFYILMICKSLAYIDPGTGSIIIQAILGFIAAAIATISFYWSKFKLLISKLFKKEKKDGESKD